MNDLLTKFDPPGRKNLLKYGELTNRVYAADGAHQAVEMLDEEIEEIQKVFFEEVSKIQSELDRLKKLYTKLQDLHEESKIVHKASEMKALRQRMDNDVVEVSRTSKAIQGKLKNLDTHNLASRKVRGCGEGTPTDRRRHTVTNSLRKKLKDLLEDFGVLRERIIDEYRNTIERRYYAITGHKADDNTIDTIIETGESETFLQKAIQEQGRGKILDTIIEIHERHDAVKEIERNLLQLQVIFQDMAVLVEAQGDQLNDIEHNMMRVYSYHQKATTELNQAKTKQRNKRKWGCCALFLLLILLGGGAVALFVFLNNAGIL